MIASYLLSRTLVPTLVMLLMGDAHAPTPTRKPSLLQRALPQLRRALRARARAPTRWRCRRCCRGARAFASAVPRLLRCCRACSTRCSAATSSRASTPARSACTCARPPARASRRRRASPTQVEAAIRELVPAGPARDHPRQPRRAQQRHQPLVQQRRHHRHARRRDPAVAAARATGRPRSSSTLLRAELPQALPRHRVLLPAGRHRHADPQLRPARGDRRAVHRRQPRRATRRSPPSSSKAIRKIPGAVDAHVHQRLDGPALNLQMDRTRLQQFGLTAFNVGQNVLIVAVGQLADRAGVLAQPAERRRLQHRGADAAVPASTRSTRCSTCRSAPAARRRGAAAARSCSATWSRRRPARQLGGRLALQHLAGDRRLRQRAGHRPRQRGRRRCRSWSTRCGPSCRAAARS